MIEDPWAECTKKTEFAFADEPTDGDLVDEEPDTGLDLSVLSGSPNTAAAADESDDDDDE